MSSLRPPTSIATMAAREAALGALDSEIREEQASSLGRAGRRLEKAIADLAAADDAKASTTKDTDQTALLAEAREALWYLVVQREACGLRNTADVLAVYSVPTEVSQGISLPKLHWRWRR